MEEELSKQRRSNEHTLRQPNTMNTYDMNEIKDRTPENKLGTGIMPNLFVKIEDMDRRIREMEEEEAIYHGNSSDDDYNNEEEEEKEEGEIIEKKESEDEMENYMRVLERTRKGKSWIKDPFDELYNK